MITPAQMRTRFPGKFEIADGFTDDFLQLLIDEAALQISESVWGDYYNYGLYYLTAHLATSSAPGSGGGATAGPVSSKRIGEVAVSYAVTAAAVSSTYGSTSYGLQYEELRDRLQGGPVVVQYGG